jgi:hypothetical protein
MRVPCSGICYAVNDYSGKSCVFSNNANILTMFVVDGICTGPSCLFHFNVCVNANKVTKKSYRTCLKNFCSEVRHFIILWF